MWEKDKRWLQGARCECRESTGLPVDQSAGQGNAKDKMKETNAGWRIVIADSYSVGNKCGKKIKDGFELQGARCECRESTSLPVYQSAGQENVKDKMKETNAGWRIVIVWGIIVGKIQEKTRHAASLLNPPHHYIYDCNFLGKGIYILDLWYNIFESNIIEKCINEY